MGTPRTMGVGTLCTDDWTTPWRQNPNWKSLSSEQRLLNIPTMTFTAPSGLPPLNILSGAYRNPPEHGASQSNSPASFSGYRTPEHSSSKRSKVQVSAATAATSLAREHVTLWNKAQHKKLSGNAAPLRRNVAAYLAKHPEYEIYDKQDEASPSNDLLPPPASSLMAKESTHMATMEDLFEESVAVDIALDWQEPLDINESKEWRGLSLDAPASLWDMDEFFDEKDGLTEADMEPQSCTRECLPGVLRADGRPRRVVKRRASTELSEESRGCFDKREAEMMGSAETSATDALTECQAATANLVAKMKVMGMFG